MKRASISQVLSLAFSALAALAVGLLLFVLARYAEHAVERDAGRALQYFAHNLASELDQEVYRYLESLSDYAHLTTQGDDAPDLRRRKLEAFQRLRPVYSWLGFVDQQGIIRIATHGEREGLNVAGDPAFVAGLRARYVSEARAQASETAQASKGLRLDLEMAVPIHDVVDQPSGLLAARLNWDWVYRILDEKIRPANKSYGIEIFILDTQGKFILAPPGVNPVVPALIFDNKPHLVRWDDGKRYLAQMVNSTGYRDYPGLHWRILVRQPESQVLAEFMDSRVWILLLGATVVLGCGLLGWFLARKIARPLFELTRAAEALRAGQSAHIPVQHTYRETHTLARTLAHLLGLLVQEKRKLADLNASLEEQVVVRTRLLEEANEHLMETLRERHELISKLETLALTDTLTGLANRRAFFERAEVEIHRVERSRAPLSLVAIDIDYFKKINDRYGHEGGDQVLRAFAKTAQPLLRDVDLLARLGGEEFVALLPDAPQEAAKMVAERPRHGLAELRTVHHHDEIRFTVSLGVAQFRAGETLKAWLARADAALYVAKGAGRNQVQVWRADGAKK